MTKQQVLFIDEPNVQSQGYSDFAAKYDCIHYTLSSRQQLIEDLNNEYRNIEAIYGGWPGLSPVGGCDQELIEQLPKHLKIITLSSIGFNGYDLQKLAEKGIAFTNAPSEIASNAVADLVLYNTLSSFRNFQIISHHFKGKYNNSNVVRFSLKHGQFDQENGQALITPKMGASFSDSICGRPSLSPSGSNAVIIGFGSIGQIIGQRLSSIGMNIHYVKRNKLSPEESSKLSYDATYHQSLQDTTEFADLVIIACPGGPSTKHLINPTIIQSMAKPFRVINIGRGTSIDEPALVAGLKTGKIIFAGLDVFEEEPQVHPELLNRQDVVLTPHVGSGTFENFDYTMNIALSNIDSVLSDSGKTITRVN